MSYSKLKSQKNCLNCGRLVKENFCSHCGQENIESRKPFHYLFWHFIEDFTHYDGHFWGTIKNLFFRPGSLTEIYIAGKRKKFVPPVKLYIFTSFITFFLFALFPPFSVELNLNKEEKALLQQELFSKEKIAYLEKSRDSIQAKSHLSFKDSIVLDQLTEIIEDPTTRNTLSPFLEIDQKIDEETSILGFKNRESYDSAIAVKPSTLDFVKTPIAYKFFELKEKGARKSDIIRNLIEVFFRNLPKALFIYLPIFAFFLWVFHNKKKYWYFDHGIFTLHYFSFLLLTILAFSILYKINDWIHFSFINTIFYLMMLALFIYSILYFFIAHHRVYRSQGIVSFLKGSVLFTFNFIAFLFLLIGLGLISFLMIN